MMKNGTRTDLMGLSFHRWDDNLSTKKCNGTALGLALNLQDHSKRYLGNLDALWMFIPPVIW